MKEIEYLLPNSVDDLINQHFIMYNPGHKQHSDWHYEYSCLQDALNDGITLKELSVAVTNGFVRICLEISEVVE